MKFRNLTGEVDILNHVCVTHTVEFVDTVLKLNTVTPVTVVSQNPKHDALMNGYTHIHPHIREPNRYLVDFVTHNTLAIKGIKINSDDSDNIFIEVEMVENSVNMTGETK